MQREASRRIWNIVSVLIVFAAVGLGVVYALTPNYRFAKAIEGRPLLEQEGTQFTDKQVGITFTPPPGWAMQSRSTESPTTHKTERTVVKFKWLVPGPKAAWFKVTIADVMDDPTAAQLIRTRKPREEHFTKTKEPEDDLTVSGRPASRATFGGEMEPDGKGTRHCTTEIVVVRHGKQALIFMGTYATNDPEGQKMIRDAIDSVKLDPQ